MFGMDLSRVGYNAEAATMTNSILDATKQYLDSATITNLSNAAKRYTALSHYNPYQIKMPQTSTATVPFTILPIGPADKGSVLMHLIGSRINGMEADITFDTGAGANMISTAMAEKYNLIPLEDATITVSGMAMSEGFLAIAKELKIGDIILYDVPFIVLELTSNNEEADQYFDAFNIMVGSELMLQLKDLTIDFISHQIIIPTTAPTRSDAFPNMCFSSSMNLLTKGEILDTPMLMCLDSGDAAFGSVDYKFYNANKQHIIQNGRPDSIRSAGIAGYLVENCYYVPQMSVTIGGTTVTPPEFVVMTQNSERPEGYDARIGLRTMMLYSKIRFNMVDFVVSAMN